MFLEAQIKDQRLKAKLEGLKGYMVAYKRLQRKLSKKFYEVGCKDCNWTSNQFSKQTRSKYLCSKLGDVGNNLYKISMESRAVHLYRMMQRGTFYRDVENNNKVSTMSPLSVVYNFFPYELSLKEIEQFKDWSTSDKRAK